MIQVKVFEEELDQQQSKDLINIKRITDTTDPVHGEVYIPYSFSLDRDRTIYKIYNGWYHVGRPTIEEIRQDWRALLSHRRDYVYDPSRAPAPKGNAFYDRRDPE